MPNADAMLNLAWAILCLAAFAWFIRFEQRRALDGRRALVYRGLALSLALVSLFPCVSASDDAVWLQFLGAGSDAPDTHRQTPLPGSKQTDKKALGTLVRLLEALESVQIAVSLVLSLILCLFALALVESHKSLDRFLPTRGGRAPPTRSLLLIPVC
jgi:hypothetical protein